MLFTTQKLLIKTRVMEKLNLEANTISFHPKENQEIPVIKLCGNGDIFVKGKLIENDIEVVQGMRDFLKNSKPTDWSVMYAEYMLDISEGKLPTIPFSDSHKIFEWFKNKLK
jgi:hypothetical protein